MLWLPEALISALNVDPSTPLNKHVSEISIDSRTIKQDGLFVALKGDSFDGHAFIKDAIQNGACAAIVSDASLVQKFPSFSFFVVDDTLQAFHHLAKASRRRLKGKVIAITGSVGKTTLKEMIGQVLKNFGKTFYSPASFNNHWGVPFTLCNTHSDCDFVVVEIGTNHPGEIKPLSKLACPHVAIIGPITSAHIGHFESERDVAFEKSFLACHLTDDGIVVLNTDHDHIDYVIERCKTFGNHPILTYGHKEEALWKLEIVNQHLPTSPNVIVATSKDGRSANYQLSIPGMHSAVNSLAALAACCDAFKLPLEQVSTALHDVKTLKGRGIFHHLSLPQGDITLIDDAYNANPTSMKAGLTVLSTMTGKNVGRKIAIIADMRELGCLSQKAHEEIGFFINNSPIDDVFTFGPDMISCSKVLDKQKRRGHYDNLNQFKKDLLDHLKSGDIVFVKGSKSTLISQIVDFLIEEGNQHLQAKNCA